ncbi:MAG: dihydrodipicolinate reductase C-terminal domain-containing protein [Holophaga sp.]|nr:dihydrodipicolinate reductase C-terminal domain-containing protein [Holophaga sp.]
MKVGIFGRGRLGTTIAHEFGQAPNWELLWHVDRGEDPGAKVDVAIDASVSNAVPSHLDWAVATSTDLVIGTTGWTLPNLAAQINGHIGVLVAPNFSLSVALMARLSTVLGRFAALDETLDPYLLEHHHRAKMDAPSGTAKRLAAAVIEGCPRKTKWTLGSPGANELNIAVLRAGSEFGMHTVGLDGPAETLSVVHQARSRALFAQGALRAAAWLRGRKGLHTFDEVAAEVLAPLFDSLFSTPSTPEL